MISQIFPVAGRTGSAGGAAAAARFRCAARDLRRNRSGAARGRHVAGMDRFVSNFTLRLDAKGRVSIPASYRAVLARDGFDGLYCYPALDQPAVDAGGNALLGEIEALIASYPPYSDERDAFTLSLYGTSETLKIDGEGRVILSDALKTPCGDHRGDRVRRPRPQISDLGARTLPRAARGGHRDGARVEEATGLPGGGARSAQSTGMMAGSDGKRAVAGGLARHIPVLARQVFEQLAPRDGGVYIDGTFGAGGHTRAILRGRRHARHRHRPRPQRDRGRRRPGRAGARPAHAGRGPLLQSRSRSRAASATTAVDGILLDLGVSSMQLDEAERGFSFRNDGPLDMRMGGEGPSAADLVNAASERDLAHIIATLGEERFARNVARAIVKARAEAADHDHARARRHHRAGRAQRGRARSIRRRARSRRCACS